MSGVYWEASRECRYSGTRRGIGGKRMHWGAPRDVGGVGAVRGDIRRCRGCIGCIGGWQEV